MSYVKTKGIIIKEVSTGESDKVVTIFSRNHGKITGFAKGAKRPKSRLVAGAQFLCYSEFVLYKGKEMYNISSCDVIEPFYNIRNDMVRLTYAAHMVDIINDIVQEEQPSFRVLQLFLNTLHMLSKTEREPELLIRIFELRLMAILGYAPQVDGCLNCNDPSPECYYFSFRKCGLLCGSCLHEDNTALRISGSTAMALKYVVHAHMKELFNFNVSSQVLNELSAINRQYMRDKLERDYRKLDFLKSLES